MAPNNNEWLTQVQMAVVNYVGRRTRTVLFNN